VRVVGGVGQKVFNGTYGLATCSLVLLEDDGDPEAGADVFTLAMAHNYLTTE
jgi:hypothetical protein